MGLVIPVADQGTFPLVWDFINHMPETDNHTGVFLVDTMGYYSGGIIGPVGKILKKKALKFAEENSPEIIAQQFVDLFKRMLKEEK